MTNPTAPLEARPAPGRPWATAMVVASALLAAAWPAGGEAMIYDRAALLRGEIWRLWTGHAVHLGWSHLGWNLAVLIPIGIWLERIAPRPARWFLALAPGLVSAGLLGFVPDLARYAGLSALATGLMVLLALVRLRSHDGDPAWVWIAALVLVVGKIVVEATNSDTLFAALPDGARVVPLAHVLGVVGAVVAGLGRRGSRKPT